MQNTLLKVGLGIFLLLTIISCQPPADLADMKKAFQKGECQNCHPAIWREWKRSLHAKSWSDPIYQKMVEGFPNRRQTCDPCHAPQPILITGLGQMPRLRQLNRESGVSCLTCHVDVNGSMHGPKGSRPANFHSDVVDSRYAQNATQLCATCHGQPSVSAHQQIRNWQIQEQKNKNCTSCHMPANNRLQSTQSSKPIRGRKHTWEGSHSRSMLKRSAKLTISRTKTNVVVTVENKTGHQLPGDGLRTIILEVSFGTNTQQYFFSANISPNGLDLESDDRLAFNHSKEFNFSVPKNQLVTAKLFYQLLPHQEKTDWVLIAETEAKT